MELSKDTYKKIFLQVYKSFLLISLIYFGLMGLGTRDLVIRALYFMLCIISSVLYVITEDVDKILNKRG